MRLVVTNNSRVRDYFAARNLQPWHELVWVDGYTEDVLRHVRDLCHKNHRLITHPLTGSIKPNQTPYKTVVVESIASPAAELESVALIETALRKTTDMLADKPRPRVVFQFLDDFAVIDLDFFKNYLGSVTNYWADPKQIS